MGLRHPVSRLAAWTAGRTPPWALQAMYRLGPITRLLRDALNRSVPAGLTELEVAGGPLSGMRLLLDLRLEKDLWLGAYEPNVLAAMQQFVRPGMTVYDVGAHIGYLSLYLAQLVGEDGRVVAFEPLPANQERLRTHLVLNGLQGRVELVPVAVGEAAARQPFRPHASVAMGRLVSGQSAGPEELQVEVVSLDDYSAAAGEAPDLVKLDIEGGEAAALRGMRRILREGRPPVVVEIHGAEAARGTAQELQAAGYRLYRLARGYPALGPALPLPRRNHVLGLPPGGELPG